MLTKDLYRAWADDVADESPIYCSLAHSVADDERSCTLLDQLPEAKRQPNLLFGAMRWHGLPIESAQRCVAAFVAHPEPVLALMRVRRTQTNEAGRCAALLPGLALLPGPLALIEIGASAGLCLRPDAWGYRYLGPGIDHRLGRPGARPMLTCEVDDAVLLPAELPQITWRAGLDLHPIDPADPDERRWLQCLVWPEHADRAVTLDVALDVAAAEPARIVTGDMVHDLDGLIDEAPSDATVVVQHSAAMYFLDPADRQAVLDTLARRGVHRIGMEGVAVLPHLAAQIPPQSDRRMVLSLDDRALGIAHPHGRSLRWIAPA